MYADQHLAHQNARFGIPPRAALCGLCVWIVCSAATTAPARADDLTALPIPAAAQTKATAQTKLEDNVLVARRGPSRATPQGSRPDVAAPVANSETDVDTHNVPYPPRIDKPLALDVSFAGNLHPGSVDAQATNARDGTSNAVSVVAGAKPPLANAENLEGALNGVAGSAGTPSPTLVYTQMPDNAPAELYGDRAERGVHGSIAVTAGTSGTLETAGSVTIPLLNNDLILRISGAKGSGQSYGSFDRGSFSGDGFYNDGFSRYGVSRYGSSRYGSSRYGPSRDGNVRGGDSTRIGLDLQWTPSDHLHMDAQTSQSSGETHIRRR